MYWKRSGGWEKHIDFMLWDIVCLQLAYALVNLICWGPSSLLRDPVHRDMVFILFFCQVLVMFYEENFKKIMKREAWEELKATMRQAVMIILVLAFYLFSTKTTFSRSGLFIIGEMYFLLSFAMRCQWKKVLKRRTKAERSLVIITTARMAERVIRNLQESNYNGIKIAGLALADKDAASRVGQEIYGIPVVATIDTVEYYVCREWVDEVFLTLPREIPLSEALYRALVEMGVTVHLHILRAMKQAGQKQSVETLGSYTVLSTSVNMVSMKDVFYKRTLDILGGLVGCAMTLIFCVFVGPLIYLQSPGPIFYSQERVGKNGKTFRLYKFRSMYLDADERKKALMEQNEMSGGLMFKMKDDPRIIGGRHGIGGIIRKYSIDEFPQFWNVLRGEMGLVGTRPPTVEEWEKYELWHRVRLAAKPGITGMWQVSGRNKITDFEEVVRLDRQYILDWSIRQDIMIMLKTVLMVFKGDGV